MIFQSKLFENSIEAVKMEIEDNAKANRFDSQIFISFSLAQHKRSLVMLPFLLQPWTCKHLSVYLVPVWTS